MVARRRIVVTGAMAVAMACVAAGCADRTRATVGPLAPTTASPAAGAAAAGSTTTLALATSTAATAGVTTVGPSATSTATSPATSTGTSTSATDPAAASVDPLRWDTAALAGELAPLGSASTPLAVTRLERTTLLAAIEEPATGPVLGVIGADGHGSVVPRDVVSTARALQAVDIDGGVVIAVQPAVGAPVVAVRRAGGSWTRLAVDAPAGAFVGLAAMGERALVTFTGPTDAVGGERWRAAVVGLDGAVAAVPEPPVPEARPGAGTTTVWSGRELLVMVRDAAADDRVLSRPYAFDPSTSTWRAIALPPWLACAPRCGWYGPHEGGDPFLLAAVGGQVVLHGYVGSPGGSQLFTGAYDAAHDTWRELPQPPVQLELAVVAPLAGGGLVAVPTSAFHNAHPDVAARLDLAAGRWSTDALPVPQVGRVGAQPGVADVRRSGDRVLVAVSAMGAEAPAGPQAVLHGGAWRSANAADAVLWRRLANGESTIAALLAG